MKFSRQVSIDPEDQSSWDWTVGCFTSFCFSSFSVRKWQGVVGQRLINEEESRPWHGRYAGQLKEVLQEEKMVYEGWQWTIEFIKMVILGDSGMLLEWYSTQGWLEWIQYIMWREELETRNRNHFFCKREKNDRITGGSRVMWKGDFYMCFTGQ